MAESTIIESGGSVDKSPPQTEAGKFKGLDDDSGDSEYKAMIDFLASLRDGKKASIEELDKQVLTLSAGALTLSVAVIHLTTRAVVRVDVLRWAWLLLLLSIGLTIVSMICSACTFWYMDFRTRSLYEARRDWRGHDAKWGRWATRVLTVLSPLSLLAGFVFLVTFTFANITTTGAQNAIQEQTSGSSTQPAHTRPRR